MVSPSGNKPQPLNPPNLSSCLFLIHDGLHYTVTWSRVTPSTPSALRLGTNFGPWHCWQWSLCIKIRKISTVKSLSNWVTDVQYTHTQRAGQRWLLLSLCFWSVKLSPDARGTRRSWELVFAERRIPVHICISQIRFHCIKRVFKTSSKTIKIKTLMSLGASLTRSVKMLPKRENAKQKVSRIKASSCRNIVC